MAPSVEELRRLAVCSDRCEDLSQHEFYANGGGFVWKRPTFHLNKTTPPQRRFMVGWNHYPHCNIGAYVQLGQRCLAVNWKGSPRA